MSESLPVEFASWPTEIENDRLELVRLSYDRCEWVELPEEDVRLEVPGFEVAGDRLVALFLSLDKRKIYRISSSWPSAFRVLDEHGLVELWEATADQGGRPGSATFRVRNHGWSQESFLSFEMGGDGGFSYMIATGWDCLEIICSQAPTVECVGDAVARQLSPQLRH